MTAPSPLCGCEDLVAIVTGGGRGIGRAVARGLSEAGSHVVVVGRTEAPLLTICQEIKEAGRQARAYVADITDESSIAQAVSATIREFGRIDILVNNAGSAVNYGRAERLTRTQWEETIRVNLTGAFLFSRAVAEHMLESRSGSIVMISSIDGLVGIARMSAYSAAKAGLIGLTKALAVEWADRGIRVNCVCPGGFETGMTAASRARLGEGTAAHVLNRTPQHRYASVDEAVSSVLYFASRSSSFTTGAVLSVDGGFSAA